MNKLEPLKGDVIGIYKNIYTYQERLEKLRQKDKQRVALQRQCYQSVTEDLQYYKTTLQQMGLFEKLTAQIEK